MRNLKRGLIYFIALYGILLVGCSNLNSENNAKITNVSNATTIEAKDNQTTTKESSNNTQQTTVDDSTKEFYLNKLNKLDTELKESFNDRYSSSITKELVDSANLEYTQWDDLLNEIYSQLKNTLSEDEMNSLTSEQLSWIDERDRKCEEAKKENEGGTIAPLNRMMSLIDSTKTRCYDLVNNYM